MNLSSASEPRRPAAETVDVSSETMAAPTPSTSLGLDATLAADDARVSQAWQAAPGPRSTVLPRVEGGAIVREPNRARYETVEALGEGAMGEVMLATDHDIDRRVAIKRMRAEHRGTHALLRFAQEIRTVGNLEHPNIVPVHDVGVDEQGQHYFVMKYVEGETLARVIERLQAGEPAALRRFPHEVRAQIFLGVLRAVQYAHARGIVHRDIKPANIMVGPFGEVMVMDWGLAKRTRDAEVVVSDENGDRAPSTSSLETQHGTVMGTPHYMAPEQARGETDRIGPRSDVYSLSVLFHELVSLRHYLDGKKTVNEVLAYVATMDIHPRTTVDWIADSAATKMPMEYVHSIRRGMEPNPDDRWADAGAMADALEDLMSGRIAVQCHLSFTKRFAHEVLHAIDRHQIAASVLIVGGVVAALAGLWSGVGALLRVAG